MIETACKTAVPVDAFMASLPKRASCCIGVCSIDQPDHDPCLTQASIGISRAWSLRTQRPACVITARNNLEAQWDCKQEVGCQQDESPCEPSLRCWDWLREPDFPMDGYSGPIASDVAGLAKLKSEHGLILIELGSVESLTAHFASKLCDGLMLLASGSASTYVRKKIKSQIRLLQRPDCQWLGYWFLALDQETVQA